MDEIMMRKSKLSGIFIFQTQIMIWKNIYFRKEYWKCNLIYRNTTLSLLCVCTKLVYFLTCFGNAFKISSSWNKSGVIVKKKKKKERERERVFIILFCFNKKKTTFQII